MQNVKAARALNVTAARGKKTPFTVHRSPTVHRYNGNSYCTFAPPTFWKLSLPPQPHSLYATLIYISCQSSTFKSVDCVVVCRISFLVSFFSVLFFLFFYSVVLYAREFSCVQYEVLKAHHMIGILKPAKHMCIMSCFILS